MRTMLRSIAILAAGTVLLAGLSRESWATHEIRRSVMSGGGGRSNSSHYHPYTLTGTIGQPSPVGRSSITGCELESGFWACLSCAWVPPWLPVRSDDFDLYARIEDLKDAGWLIESGSGGPFGPWRLWSTGGDPLGGESPDIDGMTENYVIAASNLAPTAEMDEELITPVIDFTDWMDVHLDFNKNFRVDPDDLEHLQVAEVDIRSYDEATGWSDWINLLHFDRTTVVSGWLIYRYAADFDGRTVTGALRWAGAEWVKGYVEHDKVEHMRGMPANEAPARDAIAGNDFFFQDTTCTQTYRDESLNPFDVVSADYDDVDMFIGHTTVGDWFNYTFGNTKTETTAFPADGVMSIAVLASSGITDSETVVDVLMDEVKNSEIRFTGTGWEGPGVFHWRPGTDTWLVTEGQHTIRLELVQGGCNLAKFRLDLVAPEIDRPLAPQIDSRPEHVDISSFADGRQVQVRWHFYDAKNDYWFAVDDIVFSGVPVPQVPPAVTGMSKVGSELSLTWAPFGDERYTVQCTNDLHGGAWENALGTWPTTETNWTSEDLTGIPLRYYRVMSE